MRGRPRVASRRHARIAAGRHRTLSLLPELVAFRLPAALFFGLLCALVYLFFAEALGTARGALVAALLMVAQPRAFFHAETAAFDLPAAALWFATTYAYWRALRSESWGSAIVTGLLYGLSLLDEAAVVSSPARVARPLGRTGVGSAHARAQWTGMHGRS